MKQQNFLTTMLGLWRPKIKLSQNQKVMNYMMKYGGIGDDEARLHLGVRRLSARIYDLRKDHAIHKIWIKSKNADGKEVRFARYKLGIKQ